MLGVTPVGGYLYNWSVTSSNGSWTITSATNRNNVAYTAGTAGSTATFTLTVTDIYGCTGTCSVTFGNVCSLEQHCTYTQGFYGGGGKNCLGVSVIQTIINALSAANGGDLWIGSQTTTRSLRLTASEASCINTKLPAGSTASVLPLTSGNNISCSNANGTAYLFNGKFRSVLVGQQIALGLNLRNDATLGSMVLVSNQFTTAKASSCVNGSPVAGTEQTFCIPLNVWNCLSEPKTVNKLFQLGNRFLGNESVAGCSATLSQVNAAIDAINRGFDKCRVLLAWGTCGSLRDMEVEEVAPTSITADGEFAIRSYPNPMNENAIIEIYADTDATATVEVFASNGQLVAQIFKGQLSAGEYRNFNFNASQLSDGMYICKMLIDGHVYYHKMLVNK
jgi:hypothetical protein